MISRTLVAAAGAVGLLALCACKTGDYATAPGDGPAVVTQLTCTQNGVPGACTLPVEAAITSFDVIMAGSSCAATNDRLRIVSPTTDDLTSDACHVPMNKKWTISGPYAGGSAINIQMLSSQLERTPILQATGQYPQWTLTFEDGGDADINDVVLTVTAHPAS